MEKYINLIDLRAEYTAFSIETYNPTSVYSFAIAVMSESESGWLDDLTVTYVRGDLKSWREKLK